MTDKEKLEKIKQLADIMYNKMQNLTTDTSGIRKAMDDYHQFIIYQYYKEEPVSDELEKVVEEIVDPTVLNAYGVKEIANRLRRTMIEPVSEELEEEINNYVKRNGYDGLDSIEEVKYIANHFAKWQKTKDDSCTSDLGDYINELSKQFPEVSFAKLSRIAVRVAKWQKENLWKPANGEELPEYEQEVIVLTQPYPLKDSEYAVYFAHRPDPKGWDGKSVTTGKVEHYTPKTYDKGGWNIPDVKYWLDCSMPK